jgi:hypothetical protein
MPAFCLSEAATQDRSGIPMQTMPTAAIQSLASRIEREAPAVANTSAFGTYAITSSDWTFTRRLNPKETRAIIVVIFQMLRRENRVPIDALMNAASRLGVASEARGLQEKS